MLIHSSTNDYQVVICMHICFISVLFSLQVCVMESDIQPPVYIKKYPMTVLISKFQFLIEILSHAYLHIPSSNIREVSYHKCNSVVCNICITRGRVHWTWGLLYWSITIIRTCLFCTIGLVETVYNLDLVTSTWMFSSECSVLIACICVPQADRELLQYTRKTRKPKHSIQDLCPIQKTADKVRCTLSLTWIK